MGRRGRVLAFAWAIALACAAAGCAGKSAAKATVDAGASAAVIAPPVGRVSALAGEAWATRAGVKRALAVGADVFADDDVATGVGASLSITFVAGGTYDLGAEREKKLADVVAKLADLGGGAAAASDDVTASAGRHAEANAADTIATALTEKDDDDDDDDGDDADDADKDDRALDDEPQRIAKLKLKKPAPKPAKELPSPAPDTDKEFDQLFGESNSKQKSAPPPPSARAPAPMKSAPRPPADKPTTSDRPPGGNDGRDAQSVRATFSSAMPKFRRCHETGLKKNPSLAGDVKLALTISRGGQVTAVKIDSSTLANKAVEDCLLKVARALNFGPADDTLRVKFPLQFRAP